LIAAGHDWPGLLEYTPRQLLLFYREAVAASRSARADRVVDVQAAMAPGAAARQLVEALRRGS